MQNIYLCNEKNYNNLYHDSFIIYIFILINEKFIATFQNTITDL